MNNFDFGNNFTLDVNFFIIRPRSQYLSLRDMCHESLQLSLIDNGSFIKFKMVHELDTQQKNQILILFEELYFSKDSNKILEIIDSIEEIASNIEWMPILKFIQYCKLKDFEKAKGLIQNIMSIRDFPPSIIESCKNYVSSDSNDNESILEILEQLLNSIWSTEIIASYLILEKYESALKFLKKVNPDDPNAVISDPDDPLSKFHTYLLGRVFFGLENYEQSKKYLEIFLEIYLVSEGSLPFNLSPTTMETLIDSLKLIITSCLELSLFSEAIEYTKKLMEILPEDNAEYSGNLVLLSVCLYELGRFDEALSIYEKILKITKNDKEFENVNHLLPIKYLESLLMSLLIEHDLFYKEIPTEEQKKQFIQTQKELADKEYEFDPDKIYYSLVPKSDFVQRVREKFVSKKMDYLIEKTDLFSDDKPAVKRSKMSLMLALRDTFAGKVTDKMIFELCTYVLGNSNFDKVYMTCAKTKDGWKLNEN